MKPSRIKYVSQVRIVQFHCGNSKFPKAYDWSIVLRKLNDIPVSLRVSKCLTNLERVLSLPVIYC